jgi:hypothetical protein
MGTLSQDAMAVYDTTAAHLLLPQTWPCALYHTGFHLATKTRGESATNEWAYVSRQVPWVAFLEFL